MKCSDCGQEHDVVMLVSQCHPEEPFLIRATGHEGDMLLEVICAVCKAPVALFKAQRSYTN